MEIASVEIPQYKSHKTVRAARITAFRQNGNPETPSIILGDISGIVEQGPEWFQKHDPQIGGYYVLYEDGYASFSPAKAFEEGYARLIDSPSVKADPIEQEIQAKGLTAPRVTPADIEANIASEYFFLASDGAFNSYLGAYPGCEKELSYLTFCVLVLRNGFTVTGESACASPENFDAEIGRKIARQNAVQKIWTLMGYELKERIWSSAQYGE